MAPNKQAKIAASHQAEYTSHSDPSSSFGTSQSQDHQAAKLQEAGKRNREKIHQRRDQQKKAILSSHNKRQAELKQTVESCLKSHDEEVRAIRRPQFERLLQLAQQKRAVEEKIEKCQSELDEWFLWTANQLQVGLHSRIERVSD